MLSRFSRLKISAKVMTPKKVPVTVALPPARAVPPMTTAAIASSSTRLPTTGEALASRPDSRMAEIPTHSPVRT